MTKEENLAVLEKHLAEIDDVIAKGKYKDNWNSLMNHPVPTWYTNAKLGIFIHWGIYSVPAYGHEWYCRWMYKQNEKGQHGLDYFKHHVETYGPHKEFGYKDFIPMFKAENYNPAQWAELFKEAGAKFVMPVAEHHDGFQMYDSELSDWCATKMGPKQDCVGKLKTEVEKQGLVFAASSHRVEHYWFMHGGTEFDSDFDKDLQYGDMYWPSRKEAANNGIVDVEVDELFMKDWLARTCELVNKYQPKIVFFDWWIQVKPMKPYLKKFAAYYYNKAEEWGEQVTINYKNDAFMHTVAVKDIERGQLADVSPRFWQNDTSVAKNSWGYTQNNEYKDPAAILCDFVDVVSKNGSLLLNVDPKSDGTIPEESQNILKEIGAWMKINGEAIYETTHWRKYGEGPTVTQEGHFTDMLRKEFTSEDFRFTFKDGTLYAFSLKWPEDGIVRIKTLGRKSKQFNAVIKEVSVLGSDNCKYILCDEYLTVMADGIKTDKPVCIKIVTD